jgi:hypothetical protein
LSPKPNGTSNPDSKEAKIPGASLELHAHENRDHSPLTASGNELFVLSERLRQRHEFDEIALLDRSGRGR